MEMKRALPSSGSSATKKSRAEPSSDTRHDEPSVWVETPKRTKASKVVLQTHYTPSGTEIFEDDLDSDDDEDNEGDDVPIRLLDHFYIFHQVTKEFVSALRLLTEDICEDWVGAGFVRPYSEDEDNEDEDEEVECQLVQLSSVLECNVHWPSEDGRTWSLDQEIYLLTEHGWYILQSPASSYAPYYGSLQTHHVLAHALLTHILDSPDISLNKLLENVQGHCESSHLSLSPTVSTEKLKSPTFDNYLRAVLESWKSANRLIQQIVKSSAIQELPLPLTQKLLALDSASLKCSTGVKGTVVTPRVGALARRLFCQRLHVVEMSVDGGSAVPQDVPLWPVHKGDPQVMEWGENVGNSGAFQAVVLDGTTYSVGDVVIVNPGEDFHKVRAGHASLASDWCKNNLASQKWFCKINYFYEEPGSKGHNKFFHAQWLQHGSQTFLQEAAHPRALFWLKECDNLPVECIYSHCNLQPWPLGEAAPLDNATGPENHFFTGLTLDDTAHSFSHLSPQEVQQALSHCDEQTPCVPCGLSLLENRNQECVPLVGGGIAYKGVDYHVNDFVYHHNHSGCAILHIGQINSFVFDQAGCVSKVEVCQYGRYDDLAKRHMEGPTALDNRRLFKTQVHLLVEVADIEGKPFVACPLSSRDKEQWVEADDHFYCDLVATSISSQAVQTLLPSALAQCLQCYGQLLETQTEEQLLMTTCPRLRGLELFAGAGGLSTGLGLSGFVQTKWAVELSSSAAKTLEANHQDAVVYNQDTSILLKHAIDTAEGRNPEPLVSQSGVTLPPMPQRGEVDLIYGGPPCQSFSGMNHNKKINDPRSTLACNMISYVEFYRPKYFLLENVRGILFAPTVEKLEHQFIPGLKIVMGVVKFIVSALTTLGYQVHFKVLQAGHYGAPQGRQRVIFLGARCDVPLPQFPSPQHHYSKPVLLHHLPNGEALHPHFRPTTCSHPGYMPCVPFYATTVSEAIGDLPKYDWQNPHRIIPESEEDSQQAIARLAQGIACMTAVATPGKHFTGFSKPVLYPSPPLSRYQHWIRGDNTLVTYHYTKCWRNQVVESVLNVPFYPNANHADLPPALQQSRWLEDNGESKGKYTTIYGRLDKDGCFITAVTSLVPNQKNGKILHPTQHRIITVREAARAQGFPDSYQFLSIGNTPQKCLQDQIRQIGNAVPIPLAMALGKEVGKSWLQVFKHTIYQDNVARLQSPAIE